MTSRIPNDSAFHGNLISRRLNHTIPTSQSQQGIFDMAYFSGERATEEAHLHRTTAPAPITAATGQPRCQNIVKASAQSLLWISDPVRPCFLAITSSELAQLVPNFHTLLFSPSADFCQYGLLTKNR